MWWFKVRTDFITNKKINIIRSMPDGYGIVFVWFSLLAMASECNRQGRLYFSDDMPYTNELIASALNIQINLINFSIETFKRLNMLEEITDENGLIVYKIKKYEEYQNTDGIAKAKELNRQRVIKYREKQKLLSLGSDRLEQEIYELYKSGYSLRDVGKKFNMSKNTVARIIKKIENLVKENNLSGQCENQTSQNYSDKSLNNHDIDMTEDNKCVSNNDESDGTGRPVTVPEMPRDCPVTVPEMSHACPAIVPELSRDGTINVPETVPNSVPRDRVNTDGSRNTYCNITGNVTVMSRNAYKNKNKNLDLEKENTEEEDLSNDEKRRCSIPENIITFNAETYELEISEPLLKVLKSAYPKIDLISKFKEMSLWLMANPETVSEIRQNGGGNFMRFVVKWLSNDKTKTKPKKTIKFQISFNPETANLTGLTEGYLNILKSKFQFIDIDLEIKKMESWLLNNPSRRPVSDYMRFINNWLTRAQDDKALKSSNNYSKKTWDEIRTEKNNEISKRLEEKIKAGLL